MGNLSRVQAIQCIVKLPPVLLVTLQCSLQTAFYQAQWEENYTGSLPHATGNVGVTEVTHGMAFWSLEMGLFGHHLYEIKVITLDSTNVDEPLQSLMLWWTGWLHLVSIPTCGSSRVDFPHYRVDDTPIHSGIPACQW
jgi:hypothetical protein